MDANLQKALLDRVYDKRKAATLDLERQARDALARNDRARINAFVQQLCSLLTNNPSSAGNPQSVNARNGGLIGLAGMSIALGIEIAAYLEQIVPPVLDCFGDPDSKIRYFACESFYNIVKVCKGEILMYFNEIFDALSKLAADTELSVKNGAELLDRLLKDIVCEAAPHYISQFQDVPLIRARQDALEGNTGGRAELDVAREKNRADGDTSMSVNKAFSLARFVPLLTERIYVISPFTRNYLVSWITVLDSIPDLQLVSYLPQFLDGLLKYLSDPNTDVRIATSKVLADFLREIQEAGEIARLRKEAGEDKEEEAVEDDAETKVGDTTAPKEQDDSVESAKDVEEEDEEQAKDVSTSQAADESWIPAQEVQVDYAAIIEVLLNHIAYPDEEIQATTQQWIAELLYVVKEVVVPFTPRLVPAILPNIAHHSPAIQSAASTLNTSLFQVIQDLPWLAPGQSDGDSTSTRSDDKKKVMSSDSLSTMKSIPEGAASKSTNLTASESRISDKSSLGKAHANDPFDLQTTVTSLTLQLISEHEETRISALEWLLMLHQKAPRRILSFSDGTFPALLKTLSDPNEEVVRCDLKLLAQVSSASDSTYSSYLANLVNLFSTDRRLLETRGSLIIRQLCITLHTERVFRTLAEILEKDEDLEFASIMITNLNMILITSPELADFRKRLKNLETRDGQNLFISLYRSWCHNAVATLCLCLLAQAYEHASNLLSTFPELEMTVPFLIQIDKLVQLLESPVFMTLRLQLLEPERYPHLLKTLYGLLMLLPQSSAFATLRNRLNAVSALGYLHIASSGRAGQAGTASALNSPSQTPAAGSATSASTTSTSSTASTLASTRTRIVGGNRDDLKWGELLSHFKLVQSRHERARRAAMAQQGPSGGDPLSSTTDDVSGPTTLPRDGPSHTGLGIATGTSGVGSRRLSGSGTSGFQSADDAAGTRRRMGTSPSGRANSGPGRIFPSSAVKSRLRGGSQDQTGNGNGPGNASPTTGSSSFFRLPIGTAAAAAAAGLRGADGSGSATGSSSTATGPGTPTTGNAGATRSTSPMARSSSRAGTTPGAVGASGSTASSLLGRTMGLPSSQSQTPASRRKS